MKPLRALRGFVNTYIHFGFLTDLRSGQLVYVIGLWCRHPASSLSSSVNSAPDHMVNISEFICGIYIGIVPLLIHK